MRKLRKLLSAANLTAPEARSGGQIATFLLLMTVGGLIFVLAIANLGETSMSATKAANAADAAALKLGSSLASRSNHIWNNMGQRTEKCKRRGMLAAVLAMIVAIVLQFVPGFQGWTLALAAKLVIALSISIQVATAIIITVAAAIAGFAGGYISHGNLNGALMGAQQGAIIGATIAGGQIAGAEFGGWLGGTTIAAESSAMGGAAGVAWGGATVPITVPSATGAMIGGYAGGAAGAGIGFYNAYQDDTTASEEFIDEIAKLIANVPGDAEQIREDVMFQAFSQVVDDPTLTADTTDVDGDGNTTEQISLFLFRWEERLRKLKDGLDERNEVLKGIIEGFLTGPATTFQTAAIATHTACGTSCGDRICDPNEECGWVNYCPADCDSCSDGGE